MNLRIKSLFENHVETLSTKCQFGYMTCASTIAIPIINKLYLYNDFSLECQSENMSNKQYWNPMVPELSVSHFKMSLEFYSITLGFNILYTREKPDFAYLDQHQVLLMIEQVLQRDKRELVENRKIRVGPERISDPES